MAALALPDRDKVRGVRTKTAIRRLVDERLPGGIAQRPKQGFDPPVDRWLRGELRDLTSDAIDGLEAPIERSEAKGLLDRHTRGPPCTHGVTSPPRLHHPTH